MEDVARHAFHLIGAPALGRDATISTLDPSEIPALVHTPPIPRDVRRLFVLPRSLYRVMRKMSARLRELATELGVSSRNLADVFWITLY